MEQHETQAQANVNLNMDSGEADDPLGGVSEPLGVRNDHLGALLDADVRPKGGSEAVVCFFRLSVEGGVEKMRNIYGLGLPKGLILEVFFDVCFNYFQHVRFLYKKHVFGEIAVLPTRNHRF